MRPLMLSRSSIPGLPLIVLSALVLTGCDPTSPSPSGSEAGAPTSLDRDEGYVVKATDWPTLDPLEAGLSKPALEALSKRVGGAGFVAWRGKAVHRWGRDHSPRLVASVSKSLLSTLMLMARDEGLLPSVNDRVALLKPALAEFKRGGAAAITWTQLANMTSGYGLSEAPGTAFAYNDYAVALWYDALMTRVFRSHPDQVLRQRLALPLGFEDSSTFYALGPEGPSPKLNISARDLARFGQMLLDEGRCLEGRQVLARASWEQLTQSPICGQMPVSRGVPGPMLPNQRSAGGCVNMSEMGPAIYSFHLWMNRPGPEGRRMLPEAPEDTLVASGLWGRHALWVIPSLELVVAWNKGAFRDQHLAMHDPDAGMNQAARLIRQIVPVRPDGGGKGGLVALGD